MSWPKDVLYIYYLLFDTFKNVFYLVCQYSSWHLNFIVVGVVWNMKIEYLKSRMWLFHEIKVLLNCASKCTFSKVITRFFKSNTFINNSRLKLANNLANAKQHPCKKSDFNEIIWFIKLIVEIDYMFRVRCNHRHIYNEWRKCLNNIMSTCVKQHLSNILGTIL